MGAKPAIKVTPVYGWGWIIAGEPRSEEPQPFTMSLDHTEPRHWSGVVLDDRHEFEGRRVSLLQRHADWTGNVNIVVEPFDPAGQPSTGFGTLSGIPLAAES